MDTTGRGLTLPEQFVVLLHRPTGSAYGSANQTVAAELGELVLRHRVAFEKKKVRVMVAEPTGDPCLDRLLGTLAKKAGRRDGTVNPSSVLQSQGAAFKAHRAALAERGLLTHRPKKFLGVLPDDRYVPDTLTHRMLVAEIGAVARVERPIDNRMALLCALVHASGLSRPLGFDKRERAMLRSISKGEGLGGAVEAAIAATAAALGAAAAAGAVGGGDGGGGGGGGG